MRKLINVLVVVEPGLNGVFRHAEGLCDYLLGQEGVRVGLAFSDVRSSDALGQLVGRVRAAGGPVCNLAVGNAPGPGDLKAQTLLWALVRKFSPQVIHAHSSKAGALARGLWALGTDTEFFYTPNAYYGLNRASGFKTMCFNGAESVLGRVGYTINVSESERRFARKRLGLSEARLLGIPNAVDCARFFPPDPTETARVRAGLGLPTEAWVFGTVGRYSDQKDPETLYKAVEQVLDDNPDAWFAHLGDGEAFDEMSRFMANKPWAKRVCRVRYDPQPAAFYRALDAFVLSSRFEGLPISGIEALATGLPLVFTRCPGCEDFAAMGLDGVRWGVVERPDTLATGLRAVRDLKLSQINHRAVAERRFSPTVVYAEILKAYRAAVDEREGFVV
jgi:glycosyltransferase involved in cell wall biosynthesis